MKIFGVTTPCLIFNHIDKTMENIFEIIMFAGVIYLGIYKIFRKKQYENYEAYLFNKKVALSTDEYQKFLDRQIAEITSDIEIGKHRLRIRKIYKPDPTLVSALEYVKEERRKIVSTED